MHALMFPLLFQVGSARMSMNRMKTAVEDVGVSVGEKTKRERLLDLLNHHVRKKKPRIASKGKSKSCSSKSRLVPDQGQTDNPSHKIYKGGFNSIPNFSLYDNLTLVNMLRAVGLETRGLNRDDLVKNCKIYQDLGKCDHQESDEVVIG